MQKLTKELIENRLNTFWGYGSLNAPVWIVGMEEGLDTGIDTEEIGKRFTIAKGKAMIDMHGEMMELQGHKKWFTQDTPIQPTWKYPIELYRYLQSKTILSSSERKSVIQNLQANVLGDIHKAEICTVELMPLPANKTDQASWLYADYDIQHLNSRKEYLKHHKGRRTRELKEIITKHKPKIIIFYAVSKDYLDSWQLVINTPLQKITKQMYFADNGSTKFYVIPQAQSFGMSYERIYEFVDSL